MRRMLAGLALASLMAVGGCGGDEGTPVASADGPGGAPGTASGSATGGAAPTDPAEATKAFLTCMRDRGVEIVDPPDPNDPRSAIRHELDVNGKGDDPRFQAALDACLSLLPPPPPPSNEDEAADAAVDEALHAYSTCVRNNGVPDFPDLSSRGGWTGGFVRRSIPIPTVPPEVARKCAAEAAKLDAAQAAAAGTHARNK